MTRRRSGRRAGRGGFSMLEAVIALAVMALTAALVTARASVMLDQIATHAAFQQFQTGLLALRGRAYDADGDLEATPAAVPLPDGWTYRTEARLAAEADGRCTGGVVELVRGGRVRAVLRPADDACRYLRER